MSLKNRYQMGEKWILPQGECLFLQELPGAQLLFKQVEGIGFHMMKEAELDRLRDSRQARRQRHFRHKAGRLLRETIPDVLPPDGATEKDRTRQFYVKKWDEAPCGTGDVALRRLISRHRGEAHGRGLTWDLSTSTLERAINGRGEAGCRPLRVMQDMRGKVPRKPHDPIFRKIVQRATAWYYAKSERNVLDAHAHVVHFVKRLNGIMQIKYPSTWRKVNTPSDETVRLDIEAKASLETYTTKWGKKLGRDKFQGIQRGLKARKILDVVLIDGTVVDGWCVLDNVTRTPVGRPTLTIAVDLKSRVVLGVIITYEGESLFAIMACLQQVVSGKHDLIVRLPQFRELIEDLYGKPDTILVDNAWRQTGVSFQDACEDVSINVEWAPVKNPQYKAVVERFFRTLNEILFKKMPGGIPFEPSFMRDLGLDPAKTAAITLSQLEEFIYEAIYEIYHKKPHSGIRQPPLLAWRKGLASGGREIVDDVGFLANACGAVDTATLSRSGVTFRGNTFHDPDITTSLLVDLANTTPVRKRRRRSGSATARVKIKYNPADLRGIAVWNPKMKPRRGYVFLPNWDEDYARSPGLGFWHDAQVRRFAESENLKFQTDEQRCIALDRFRARLEAAAPSLKFDAMRAKRRLLEPPHPVLRGDVVVFENRVASVSGLDANNVSVTIAAHERDDYGYPEKGPRRGGRTRKKKPTAKPKALGGADRTAADRRPEPNAGVSNASGTTDLLAVHDPEGFMKALAERMSQPLRILGVKK